MWGVEVFSLTLSFTFSSHLSRRCRTFGWKLRSDIMSVRRSLKISPYRCYNAQTETAGRCRSGFWSPWGAWCCRRPSPAPCRRRRRWKRLCRRAAGWPAPGERRGFTLGHLHAFGSLNHSAFRHLSAVAMSTDEGGGGHIHVISDSKDGRRRWDVYSPRGVKKRDFNDCFYFSMDRDRTAETVSRRHPRVPVSNWGMKNKTRR